MKVETHNHPTAISPFPGAATGSGGEIRDEGATGRGAKPKAGLCGFSVSHLRIPGFERPWEARVAARPHRLAAAIMIEGPIGAASFNNEFGRPNLAGYFRTYEQEVGGVVRGYHKPIMLAGGVGNIRARHAHKATSGRRAADPARRPRDAHRHGRRLGLVDGRPAPTPPTSTSTRCSAATPRSSAARRR
jgi:phosphoribosylformylglycinamidine synthase